MKFATLRADALLLLAAIIWGAGFVAQKAGMEFIGPYAYTGIRFLVATIALLPLPGVGSSPLQMPACARSSVVFDMGSTSSR